VDGSTGTAGDSNAFEAIGSFGLTPSGTMTSYKSSGTFYTGSAETYTYNIDTATTPYDPNTIATGTYTGFTTQVQMTFSATGIFTLDTDVTLANGALTFEAPGVYRVDLSFDINTISPGIAYNTITGDDVGYLQLNWATNPYSPVGYVTPTQLYYKNFLNSATINNNYYQGTFFFTIPSSPVTVSPYLTMHTVVGNPPFFSPDPSAQVINVFNRQVVITRIA